MNPRRLVIIILTMALALTGCATGKKPEESKKADVNVTPDGTVEGALTINGKSFPLKYVYAGREKSAQADGPGGIEVLITNEPLPYETLSRIFLELEVSPFSRKASKVLKDTSLKALYFEISEFRLEMAGGSECAFDGMLMTSDAFFDYSSLSEARAVFDDFSFKEGTIRAKASNKWEQSETGEEMQEIKIAAQYTISFEAKPSDQSLLSRSLSTENKWWQESLSRIPEAGKAEGTVMVSKRTVELTHAYTIKDKIRGRAGETIEGITLLLSDRPLRKELLLLSIERGVVTDGYLLRLSIDESGTVLGSLITHPHGLTGMFDPTSAKGFKVENGRVTGSAENVSSSTESDPSETDRYSVSFDAPLK